MANVQGGEVVLVHRQSLVSMVEFAVAGALAGEYQVEELPHLLASWLQLAEEALPQPVHFGLEN